MTSNLEIPPQQQQFQMGRQEPNPPAQSSGVYTPPFTNVLTVEENPRNISATASEEKSISFIPASLAVILGSTTLLIVLSILLIIPILELAIGAAYRNQCTINPNIPVYLIVTGACGIATILLTIAIGAGFMCCLQKESVAASIAGGCILAVVFVIIFLMSLFLLIWFIVGSVWVFGAKSKVDLNNPLSINYCHRTLFNFAFAILIISYIMMGISCCSRCLRLCCQTGGLWKKSSK